MEQKNSFLISLLSVLLLVSSIVAGIFAYQSQKVVKEINSLKILPTPTAAVSPSPDPTANWKIFESDLGYKIKYPEYLTLKDHAAGTYFLQTDPEDSESGAYWIDERQIQVQHVPEAKVFLVKESKVTIACIDNYCNSPIYNEILSTFKFIDTSPSPMSTFRACTMEAKICTDGSAVGRSGPNCEFSPCPTISPQL